MSERYTPKPSIYQKLRYILEAALVYPLYFIFRIIPYKVASNITGCLLRTFGRFHESHSIAKRNIAFAFPDKSPEEVEKLALDSWESLGRTAGEFVSVTSSSRAENFKICDIVDQHYLEEAQKNSPTGAVIVVSAHIGNWEIGSKMMCQTIPNVALIYRHANNPYVEHLVQKLRGQYTNFIIRKGDSAGFRDIYSHLKKGGSIGLLMDQKTREGIDVNFFGKPVKAVSTPAEFSIKFNLPVFMLRNLRHEDGTFKLICDPPIYPAGKTVEEITQQIYNNYERWIRQYPEQWFWMHNRWYLDRD